MSELGIMKYGVEIMCRHAVDRSQGGLLEIDIWYFCTNELLNYIADSSSNLRRLSLAMCYPITNEGLTEAVLKLPLLEDLELSYCNGSLSGESIKVVGKSCPNLKTLKLNRLAYGWYRDHIEYDDDALAIAETIPQIRHLQLFGNRLTDAGLKAILDNCPNLEHLDLRKCFNVDLVGDLKKRCSERIRVVRRPYDSTHDYPYDAKIRFMENDYGIDFSAASDYSDYVTYGNCNDYDYYGSDDNDPDHYGSDDNDPDRSSI